MESHDVTDDADDFIANNAAYTAPIDAQDSWRSVARKSIGVVHNVDLSFAKGTHSHRPVTSRGGQLCNASLTKEVETGKKRVPSALEAEQARPVLRRRRDIHLHKKVLGFLERLFARKLIVAGTRCLEVLQELILAGRICEDRHPLPRLAPQHVRHVVLVRSFAIPAVALCKTRPACLHYFHQSRVQDCTSGDHRRSNSVVTQIILCPSLPQILGRVQSQSSAGKLAGEKERVLPEVRSNAVGFL
mmetsp:Transcript_35797/g.100754  ORF Transcript_35797/g.100754 Transcript_35797/m.100754 type:complete len:245 (-) Transcript_35797:1244-1978(-)